MSGTVWGVDFELSDDQVALRAAATDLLLGSGSLAAARRITDGGGGWDRDLWSAMVDQGWAAITTPEAEGGLGLGWVEGAVLCEAVGAQLAATPIVSQLIALAALAGTGWVPGLLDGTQVAAVTRSLDTPVPFAPSADVMVALVDGRVVAFAGRRPPAESAMDGTRELGWVHLDPSDAATLDVDPELFLDAGAVAYSAELLGGSQAMLDASVAYAKERVQFDRPIGSFQAVKHRLADMLVDVEGMRSSVYWAAWCLSADDPERSVSASVAKLWCSDASKRVMASALQVHGGIGFTWESNVHLFLKRAQLDQLEFGDATFHRDRLAGLLRGSRTPL